MSKSRLSADPSVGVADLQTAFKEWLDKEDNRDVARLLKAPYPMTWKSAPTAEWLGDRSMARLFGKLFSISTNGVLASKKVKAALLKQQTSGGRLNFTKKHDSDFVDEMDEQLRIAAAMYREIKKDATKYCRCIRKASVEEKERLDSVLAILQLSEQPAEQPAPDHAETEVDEKEPARSRSPKLKPQVGQSNSAVFRRILQKVSSAPESPKKTDMALQTPDAKVAVPAIKTTGGSSGSTEGASCRPQLKRQFAFLELDKKEEEEMLRWMSTDITVAQRKKHMKRPASKTQGKQKKKAKVEKQEGPEKTKKKEKKPSFAQKVLKSSFRKRKCDAAYHSAKKKALAEGMVLQEACKVASAASARVAKKIEKGELTEE